jgi:N-acyl-D-aspartate/D-glutamate deacylase
MTHDLIIRNGLIVDGTGSPGAVGDLAVDGDRITAVGQVESGSAREIDAEGCIVTPGFVDIHTHLDAQLAWDPIGSSSCWHGVTSVVLGNCGVTFAPCKADDREQLAKMMESVEDIPADSIMSGLAWDWTSYGEYLDAVESWPKGVNVGGMVGHCAVRVHAMGERSLSEEPAGEADIEAMCALVDEAIGAGALGFSTSRTLLHRVPDGRPVPGTWADSNELTAIAQVMGNHGRGVFEAAARLGEGASDAYAACQIETEMMADISRRSGRPVTFGLAHTFLLDDLYRRVLAFVNEGNKRGGHVRPQTTARGIGILFGLSHRTPFDRSPSWKRLELLSVGEKLENSIAAVAAQRGVSAVEAFMDLSLESNGRVLLNYPFLNQRLDAVEEMLSDPNVVMGLADAGAHVGQIMDASQPTYMLANWGRDLGVFSIEECVRRLTSDTADLFGIVDRGVLRAGAFADINIIDLDALALRLPEYVHDFPGGAGRYVQGSDGYRATIVNGRVSFDMGRHTGDLAGVLLRS